MPANDMKTVLTEIIRGVLQAETMTFLKQGTLLDAIDWRWIPGPKTASSLPHLLVLKVQAHGRWGFDLR